MTYVLAILAAAAYGAGDFLGGIGARKGNWVAVALLAQVAGLAPLVPAVLLLGGRADVADLAWSIGAGVGSGIGVSMLYRALAAGRMAVVAPVTALCAIVIPVMAGIAMGSVPPPVALLGMATAIPALWLISRERRGTGPHRRPAVDAGALTIAVVAGAGLAAVYICLKQTGPESGFWPVLWARTASAALVLAYIAALHPLADALDLKGISTRLAVGAGLLDGSANLLLLLALQEGSLAAVATLASLYPAATILLAGLFLKERVSGRQSVGLALSALAAAAIAGGS